MERKDKEMGRNGKKMWVKKMKGISNISGMTEDIKDVRSTHMRWRLHKFSPGT